MLVWRCTSIGLPPRERRKRPAAPIDNASPPPSSDSPPAKAFAIRTGMSAKTSPAENPLLKGAPDRARKHEVMVVMEVLWDRHAQQQIEGLDPRRIFPQPLVEVVGLVPLATPYRRQERCFGRRDPAGILRGELGKGVGPHRRMVDVLVGKRDMLQHREEPFLALQAIDRLRYRVQPRQRVQRAAVMARRHFGGASHRKSRGRQHRLRRYPRA